MILRLVLLSAVLMTVPLCFPSLAGSEQNSSVLEERLESVRKAPTNPHARLELGKAYAEAEEYDLAMSELVESIHLNPDNNENLTAEANFHLGMVLTALERTGLATKAYREALRLGLNEAPVHTALGEALAAERQYEEAIAEYRAALNLSPDSFVAHAGLALALEASGKLDDALTEYETALQLAPSEDDHTVAAIKQRLLTLKERRKL